MVNEIQKKILKFSIRRGCVAAPLKWTIFFLGDIISIILSLRRMAYFL